VSDPVLEPFLTASGEAAVRLRLGELLEREAAPLAWNVIRGHLGREQPSELEDVHAGVMLALAEQLRRQRGDADEAPIRAFASYVAVVAHNACHAFLRRRFPARARLGSRVRYVLTRDPRLALWESQGGEWLCGRSAWRDRGGDPGSTAVLAEAGRRASPQALPEQLHALVAELPGPARFEELLDALARIEGLADRGPESASRPEATAGEVADPAPSAEVVLAQRSFLSRLWDEIRGLPPQQSAALLLNLRDGDGGGMIGLLPLTGVADVPELAQVLGMPEAELRELWDELPRDDAWIAGRLRVTRRQVINLRKCARERLARRMRGAGAWR
jgi:hypothetical protein